MDEKKKIGQKIWEFFLKNYSYSQIAKELGISKSVVSNIINYSLPSSDWCNENIKELKKENDTVKEKLTNLEKKCKEKTESLKEEKRKLKLKSILLILTGLIEFIIILFLIFIYFKTKNNENISLKIQPTTQIQAKTTTPITPKVTYKTQYYCENETPINTNVPYYVYKNNNFIPIYKIKDWNGVDVTFKIDETKKMMGIVKFKDKTFYELKKGKYLLPSKNEINCYSKKIKVEE